ncbi:MAG: hypothetical protein ACNA8W_24835 [Bradymonadaceae bacterium]
MMLATGCSRDTDDLVIEVCGNLGVPDELDSLRISILDAERQPMRSGVRELLECPGDRLRPLPQSVTFPPVVGEAWVVVTGLVDEVEKIRFERRINVEGPDFNPVVAILDHACLGFQCPLGQTCVSGRCVVAPYSVSGTSCPSARHGGDDLDAGPVEDGEDVGAGPPTPTYCPAPDVGLDDADEAEET